MGKAYTEGVSVALEWIAWLNAVTCVGWIVVTILACYRMVRLPVFVATQDGIAVVPVSVIVPACNEAATLEPALRSLLAQDHPDVQIVLVDDRSTDGTTDLVDRLAADDARITPIHVAELPDGWLGKVHALHVGTAHATADWLLFTDADIRFEPQTLRQTVSFAEAGGYDHVSLIPYVESTSFAHRILTETFGVVLVLAIPMHRVTADPRLYFGVGAFNLVRREVFERTEGFSWLRMEVADDMGLAVLMKRHGARAFAGMAWESLRVQWYDDLGQMMRGLEKNLFATAGHLSWLRTLVIASVIVAAVVTPAVGAFLPAPFGWPFSLAVLAGLALLAAVSWRVHGSNPLSVLCLPFGLLLLTYAMIRSALAYSRHGGAMWRGTLYPTAQLRAGHRVKL